MPCWGIARGIAWSHGYVEDAVGNQPHDARCRPAVVSHVVMGNVDLTHNIGKIAMNNFESTWTMQSAVGAMDRLD